MSMFHELMMRKKEEIMYATIKGTLTENDGVFSGFSSSNYLQLQQVPNFNNDFEIVVKITTGDLSTEQRILAYNTGGINSVYIQNTYLKWFIYGNSSSNILSTEALSPNTTYWIKIKRSGNEFSLSYSTDGITYRGLRTKTVTDTINSSNYFDFGANHTSYYSPFAGSIDLNNSYIKLGSTKYNLQAVVGYTVDGMIDLNNTYIKVNNKLWFNGQQA